MINALHKVPFVDLSIVPSTFKKVVLPPPEGPLIMTNYPLLIAPSADIPSKVIFLRATTLSSPSS